MAKKIDTDILWSDRKRGLFGLPWSFTKYVLTEEKLLITRGVLRQTEDEIRLYRIMDLSLNRSLFDRIDGVGTIHCCSADRSAPEFDIKRVRNPRHVDLRSGGKAAHRPGRHRPREHDAQPQ